MTAGPDEVRLPDPCHTYGLSCPDNASGCSGHGPILIIITHIRPRSRSVGRFGHLGAEYVIAGAR